MHANSFMLVCVCPDRIRDSQDAGGGADATPAKTDSTIAIDRDTLKTDGDIGSREFVAMMGAGAEAIFAARDHLCELDGAIGDGDHGITMEIGWNAVLGALSTADPDTPISETCDRIADAFLAAVGASAGPLYASAF